MKKLNKFILDYNSKLKEVGFIPVDEKLNFNSDKEIYMFHKSNYSLKQTLKEYVAQKKDNNNTPDKKSPKI